MTASGCIVLILLIVLGETVVHANAQQAPAVDRLTDALGAGGIFCSDGQFWSVPPKGQSTLGCDQFEIDVFNSDAHLDAFLHWKRKSRDARFLRRFNLDSFILEGRTWVVLTPSERIATVLKSRVSGRLLTIAR